MPDFALVTFSRCNKTVPGEQNFFRRVLVNLKRPKYECESKKIELYNNISTYVVKLPWSVDEIPTLKSSKIERMLAALCESNGIIHCFLPRNISGAITVDEYIAKNLGIRFIYKSLMLEIINRIYSSKNIKASELDIAVIEGKSLEELFSAVRLLSPMFKYITILVNDKRKINDEINRIYVDYGLSLGVTTDYINCLKNADLIINLNSSNEHLFNARINPKAIILNYGDLDVNKILSENLLINGIEISLPEKIYYKFDNNVYKYFSMPEIGEIVLAHRLGSYNAGNVNAFEHKLARKNAEEFKRDGYSISGFVGRRRTFKLDEIHI